MDKKRYSELVKEYIPKNKIVVNVIKAFIVGGLICVFAQLFYAFLVSQSIESKDAYSYTTMFMIFVGATLTGIGIYDKLGQYAGAGSIVPVTGFANSIVSSAIEFKREGLVLGTSAKMFTIAGPVLVYGIDTSIIVGLLYYLITISGG